MLIINAIRKGEDVEFAELLAAKLEIESDPDGSASDFVLQMLRETNKEFKRRKLERKHAKEMRAFLS